MLERPPHRRAMRSHLLSQSSESTPEPLGPGGNQAVTILNVQRRTATLSWGTAGRRNDAEFTFEAVTRIYLVDTAKADTILRIKH